MDRRTPRGDGGGGGFGRDRDGGRDGGGGGQRVRPKLNLQKRTEGVGASTTPLATPSPRAASIFGAASPRDGRAFDATFEKKKEDEAAAKKAALKEEKKAKEVASKAVGQTEPGR